MHNNLINPIKEQIMQNILFLRTDYMRQVGPGNQVDLVSQVKTIHSCYSCPDVVLGNSFTTLNWRYDSTWKCSVESFLEFIGNYFSLFFTNNIKGSNSIPADPDQWPPSWVPQALSRMLYHPKDAFYDSYANCYDEVQYNV